MGHPLRKALFTGVFVGPLGGVWTAPAPDVTLTNGDLTAELTAGPAFAGILGSVSKSADEWRFDTTINVLGSPSYPIIGIATSGWSPTNYVGSAGNTSIGLGAVGDIYRNNSTVASTGVTFGAGDIIRTVFHATNRTIYWMKNGVPIPGSAVSFSALSGAVKAAATLREAGDKVTSNFT